MEEKQYLEQLKNGSEQAKSVLIERNLRLVAHIARKYQSAQEDMEDLISIGTIGLIKAVSTYNLEKGSRLGTYAARCIENELLMYFRSKKKTARDVSLYEPIGTDKEGNQIKLLDIVESGEPELWERVVEKKNILRLYECCRKCWMSGKAGSSGGAMVCTTQNLPRSGRLPKVWEFPDLMSAESRRRHWKSCGRNFLS